VPNLGVTSSSPNLKRKDSERKRSVRKRERERARERENEKEREGKTQRESRNQRGVNIVATNATAATVPNGKRERERETL